MILTFRVNHLRRSDTREHIVAYRKLEGFDFQKDFVNRSITYRLCEASISFSGKLYIVESFDFIFNSSTVPNNLNK